MLYPASLIVKRQCQDKIVKCKAFHPLARFARLNRLSSCFTSLKLDHVHASRVTLSLFGLTVTDDANHYRLFPVVNCKGKKIDLERDKN